MSVGADDEIFSTQGITGAPSDRVQIRGGAVSRDQNWRNLGLPYNISGTISVYKDATTTAKLTIEPGVQIRFNGNYYINTGVGSYKGALNAVGTEGNPILFTSDKPNPQPGDWDCIKFQDATDDALTTMVYCTVEYGGSNSTNGNIYIEKASPTITNSTVRYSKYGGIRCNNASPQITGGSIVNNNTNGIYAISESLFTINGTSFSGNGSYAISIGAIDEIFSTQGITGAPGDRVQIRGGTIVRDQGWRNLGVPYSISSGTIVIGKDATTSAKLTIEPGSQVRFNGNYYIQIGNGPNKGALYAVGTESSPIVFTSDKPTPQPGDWHGIIFLDTTDDSLTQMAYCTVEYGGSTSIYGERASLYFENANPQITNCTVRYSLTNGIKCFSSAKPSIKFCNITNNNKGILSQGGDPQVNYCNIYGNSQYGLQNTWSNMVDARFNWWGHSSGPSGQGPGSGDAISNYVAHEAWLGLLFSYPYYISEGNSTTKQLTTNGGLTYYFAKTNDDSNWTIIIKDASQQTVRTITEYGKKIRQTWDGKDQSGQPLPAGSYSYQIQAQRQSDLSEATPLLGMISISTDYPISFISSPLVGDCIAKQVSIFGSANDPDFKQYKLEYGLGAVPSAWTQIKQSSVPVASGYLGAVDLSSLEVPCVTFRLTVDDNSSHTTICTCIIAFSPYQVIASPNPFSPNNDGKRDTTTISAQFGLESNWTLVIKDPTGQNVIRTWTGSGSTMSQLWDGKNESGEIQNDGIYPYLLTVSNASLPEPDIVNGAIMLDQTYPIAQITDPTEGELFSNVYGGSFLTEIFGTAADDNFVNYKLEYGETSNPTSWNLIGVYSSPVVNNKLGELSNSLLANGEYTIRLRVLDLADNESSAAVHIRVGHLRLLLSSHQLNSPQSENVVITTEVPFDATETIVIKDKNAAIVKTLVDNLFRNAGTYNDPWDGKDNGGVNLVQGAYYVVVSIVVAQDQWYFLLDLTATGGERRPAGGNPALPPFNLTFPTNFSPYKGEMAIFAFDLDKPSLVDLLAKENLSNGRERNLLKREPLASGSYSLSWDGTDDNGAFLDKSISGLDNYVVFWAYSLPDNGIVVYGEKPEVTALSVNPIYYFPADEDLPEGLEISYSISKSSNVTIFVQDNQGHYTKTMNLGTQSPGAHVAYWDGRASNGQLADSSSYRIGVSLTDSLGNISLIRYCLILVYY